MEKFIISITLVIGFSCTYAEVWTVNPDGTADCNDIQAAINLAQNGDTVLIDDGIYTGNGNRNISFLGKAITVKSLNGPDTCIIESSSTDWGYDRAFIFESNETGDSVLDGITIQNFRFLTCCQGGAGIYIAQGNPTILNCRILNCQAAADDCPCIIFGGGISISEGMPVFENCIIKGNGSSGFGGGIANTDFPNNVVITLNNCLISENYASEGGGIYGGFATPAILLFNCFVVNNYGGGIYFEESCFLSVRQCTFAYNFDYGLHYGVPDALRPTAVTRSILWENGADEMNFLLHPGARATNYTSDHEPPYTDPKFVNALNGDYHLQWDSPCIDFCTDPGYDPDDVDFDGEPRLMGEAADAGADEVGPKQADFSRNGRIDFEDVAVLAAAWQTNPGNLHWYVLCDLLSDDSIDLYDLEILADDWLWQASWFESE